MYAVSTLAVALVLFSHVSAQRRHAFLPLIDEAPHLLVALGLRDVAGGRGSLSWDAFFGAAGPTPPLFHALVAGVFGVVGPSLLAARLVNVALLALLAAATARMTRDLLGGRGALLAAGLVVSLPALTRLARAARPDLLAATLVAAILASIGFPWRRTRSRWIVVGTLLGLGLLARWNVLPFVVGPLALAWTGRGLGAPWRRADVARCLALALLVALPWWGAYLAWYVPPRGLLAGLGAVPGDPGPVEPFRFARVLLDQQANGVVRLGVLAAAIVVPMALLARQPEAAPIRRGLLALLTAMVVPYLVLTTLRSPEPDALLPAAGPLSALVSFTVGSIRPPPLRAAVALMAGVYSMGTAVAGIASDEVRWRVRAELRRWPVIYHAATVDMGEMVRDTGGRAWHADEVLAAVAAGGRSHVGRPRLLLLGEYAGLNADTIQWLARLRRVDAEVDALRGRPFPDPDAVEYVLLRHGNEPADTNPAALAAAAALARRAEFVDVGHFDTPAGLFALLRSRAGTPPDDLRPPPAGIDLREPRSRWHLGGGWSNPEPDRRWAEGAEAVLRVQLEAGRAYRLVAEVAPYPLLPRVQKVTVLYGGVPIAQWDLPGGQWREEAAELPGQLPTGGLDELRFRFAAAARPSDTQAGSADRRRLAAMFRVIRFEEAPKAGSRDGHRAVTSEGQTPMP